MKTDFIIIGSGLAGLTSALMLKDLGQVLLVTKRKLHDAASNLAQGGIAAVTLEGDSFESHIRDTLIAGAHHNDREAIEYLVRHAPQAINWLVKQGVEFATKEGRLDPTQEAAHSFARVLHSTDITGREIEKVLIRRIKKEKYITVWENCYVTDLIVDKSRCYGIRCHCEDPELVEGDVAIPSQSDKNISFTARQGDCFSRRPTSGGVGIAMTSVQARLTILATGGLGQLYEWTTNPEVATGDGIVLADRAGAKLQDLEFIQFHPTALKPASRRGKSPLFLLSEALRGEGAHLVRIKNLELRMKNESGERFMKEYDKRGELAPRDIVARAIYNEQQKGFEVFLDIRHKGKEFLLKRFPGIYKELEMRGYDLSSDLIPVTPAAHYSCGGVEVDLYGRTSVKNLFAYGEVACTGVHGANRLASNSLLEAVVFPLRLSDGIARSAYKSDEEIPNRTEESISPVIPSVVEGSSEKQSDNTVPIKLLKQISAIRRNLQNLMWSKVGIVRTEKGLKEALDEIGKLEFELNVIARSGTAKSRRNGIHDDVISISSGTSSGQSPSECIKHFETQNMLLVAKLICQSALKRKKSLGAHYITK